MQWICLMNKLLVLLVFSIWHGHELKTGHAYVVTQFLDRDSTADLDEVAAPH